MSDKVHQLLHTAVIKGDVEKVKLLLKDECDVNVKMGRRSETYLHIATNVCIIKELILRGADVNAKNLSGETPLLRAVIDGKGLLVFKALLTEDADINHSYYGSTLLHYCTDVEVTRELLSHGMSVNVRNFQGRTPLHYAVVSKNALPRVTELLKLGADVNAVDNDGETALYSAVSSLSFKIDDAKVLANIYGVHNKFDRDLEVIKELLGYGADINLKYKGCENDPYYSPFGLAINSEYLPLIKLLIKLFLVYHFNNNYKSLINLDPFVEEDNHPELLQFLDECVCEIIQMKSDKLFRNYSLYNLVTLKTNENLRSMHWCKRVKKKHVIRKYPHYHDVIMSGVELYVEKESLLLKLSKIKIQAISRTRKDNIVTLIPDCINKIGEYLTKDDLINFVAAFNNNK